MILKRLGNKKLLASKIESFFPEHVTYIEPFFGAGGMFFNKSFKAKANLLNDLDNEVYNLFKIITDPVKTEAFKELLELTPYHETIFKEFVKNEETDPVKKAVRFVYLSNFSFMGKGDTLRFNATGNEKAFTLKGYTIATNFLKDLSLKFNNKQAIDFLKTIHFKSKNGINKSFVYCDPPYISTDNNYSDKSWNEEDLKKIIEYMRQKGLRFAISEYGGGSAEEIFKSYDLNIHQIRKQNTMNRKEPKIEVLATNYKQQNTLF